LSDPHDLAARLPSPDRLALFLDVDGTLIGPSHGDRAVGITDEQVRLIGRLHERLGGALVVLTGRALDSVDKMFAPFTLPAGCLQGAERRFADGRMVSPVQTADERRALERVAEATAAHYLNFWSSS